MFSQPKYICERSHTHLRGRPASLDSFAEPEPLLNMSLGPKSGT